jgi:Chitobiase/beta-hexosaminidase C-terminal domain
MSFMTVRKQDCSLTFAMVLGLMVLCAGCGGNTESTPFAPQDAQPIFDPAGGVFSTPHTITISDPIAGSSFYYTTDGSGPTTSSTPYTGAITVSQTEELRAIAIAPGHSASFPSDAFYTFSATGATLAPVISPAAQANSSLPISVTISDAMSGATIYYTTDGTAPTPESALYTGPISVTSTQTIRAMAVVKGYANSGAAKAVYSIGGTTENQ